MLMQGRADVDVVTAICMRCSVVCSLAEGGPARARAPGAWPGKSYRAVACPEYVLVCCFWTSQLLSTSKLRGASCGSAVVTHDPSNSIQPDTRQTARVGVEYDEQSRKCTYVLRRLLGAAAAVPRHAVRVCVGGLAVAGGDGQCDSGNIWATIR